jgi:PAS domain S-box-containing protein
MSAPIVDKGVMKGMRGIGVDILLENRSVAPEADSLYRALDGVSFGLLLTDSDGTIVFANKAALQEIGYSRKQELVGRPIVQFSDPPGAAFLSTALQQMTSGQSVTACHNLLRRDGAVFAAEIEGTPVAEDNLPPQRFLFTIRPTAATNRPADAAVHEKNATPQHAG